MKTSRLGHITPIHGFEMYYEIHGEGEPLVLLHGLFGSSGNWGHVFDMDALSREYRLIVPDIRGHGRSTNPPQTLTHRQCALDVLALLDHLGIERCKAVGISFGGNMLLHMATTRRDRVDAMVLVSATSYFPPQARAVMSGFTVESRTDEEWRTMRETHAHGDEQIRALWRQAVAWKDSHDDMSFPPPHLSTITARTLLVYGDRDPLYPVEICVEQYRAIPRTSLWILPDSGHGPVFGGARGQFAATALAFLRGEQDAPSPG